ncbi:MAG: hypothetical protein M1825_000816 [Sarcosagium campestre]|nr:MAG: hypothetical protein M1825_000816 [Sarcosagium campestre]
MLSTTRFAATAALRAKPSVSLNTLRAGQSAYISSTSAKPATAVQQSQDVVLSPPPTSLTGKPRREVPLPSQEEKKGAMQYAL